MSLSYFYVEQFEPGSPQLVLDEDTSYHIVQVLRMKPGEMLQLTDGKGHLLTGSIVECHKKHCQIGISEFNNRTPENRQVALGVSLTKNASRFEWFLEKATEIGVTEIIPMICERTVKEKFRYDRMRGICISAMLQSQQTWLPILREPMNFESVLQDVELNKLQQKFIAHCIDNDKKHLRELFDKSASQLVIIGPEGDFSPSEIQLALQSGFQPVSLGNTRLRTETAGLVAATLLKLE